jgi:hypothetical protein
VPAEPDAAPEGVISEEPVAEEPVATSTEASEASVETPKTHD